MTWLTHTRKPAFDAKPLDTIQFTWEIQNFSKLETRDASENFTCGGYNWQLLLFPNGNPQSARKGSISLYLKCLGPVNKEEETWHCCASFALAMWNPECPSSIVTQASHHRFTPKILDWGYGEFQSLRSAFVRNANQEAPLIGNSLKVNVSVDLDVLNDETGVLWHDFQDYDSKLETGFTGLVNQGATCYLNSLVQSLYFTKAFRSAVYSLPDSSGVSGGLLRVFYKLATYQQPVDTTNLTTAFGWDSADAFTQHDVQELARVLMDKLESKMKGTSVDGFLSKLFVGQMKSYIKCLNVPFESSRTEDFWDIQLNVRGMKNVYDSFSDYCAKETLSGENQYAAGDYGLQDAEKGVIFEKLPPVLHLQLKRYEFDWMREIQIKINDRYEFPLSLDLSDFVSDKSRKWEFELHGVLVHSGDLNAGHYYALIKPEASTSPDDLDKGWFKFDDDRVTKATIHEVLEENFGGFEGSALRRITSAYMLVYIRKDSKDFVLPKCDPTYGLSTEMASKLKEEHRLETERMQKIVESQMNVDLQVLLPSALTLHRGPDILPYTETSSFPPQQGEELTTKRIRVGTSLSTLLEENNTGSIWVAPSGERMDTRACPKRLHIVPTPYEYTVDHLTSWVNSNSPIVFFGPSVDITEKMVFIKTFQDNELKIVGVKVINHSNPIGDELKDIFGIFGDGDVYVEVLSPNYLPLRDSTAKSFKLTEKSLSAADYKIENGEILIACKAGDDVSGYLEEVHSKVTLVLRLFPDPNNDDEEFDYEEVGTVVISVNESYESIIRKIADVLQCDPLNVMLQSIPANRYYPPTTVDSSGSNISVLWSRTAVDKIDVICRVLPVPLAKFEKMSEFRVVWFPNGYMGENYSKVILGDPDEPFSIEGLTNEDVILCISHSGRKCKELPSASLGVLSKYYDEGWDVYAAPLGPLEKVARATKGSRYCACFHFHIDPNRTHGVPFYFAVVPNEPFSITKVRIFQHLRSSGHDKALEKIKFAIVNERVWNTEYINDDSVVLYDILPDAAYLGLDHPDRSRNNPYQQQAIRID